MEEKINIAEILKDKKNGLRLYSPIFGECAFCCVRKDTNDICVKKYNDEKEFFDSKGLYYNTGEVMLFPSKEMRDWNKFSWKKGDVLTNSSGFQIFFDKWVNEDYTEFLGKIKLLGDSHCYDTAYYTLASEEEALEFIKSVEEINNGKLNRETLEIEKQPEFKDGDIVVAEEDNYYDRVIFIATIKDVIVSKALINVRYEDYEVNYNEYRFGHNRNLRLATDSEKKQLFSALEKEGKRWDSDKKAIVDLKPKCEFKPFDRCIWKIRNCEGSIWQASFVSYVDEYGASPMGMSIDEDLVNLIILPYNDKTKLLVGTTDDWKGGEQ